MSESITADRKRKGRSPSYPGINLETAVQRARQLYAKEHQHPTSVSAVVHHWGYKSLNGPGAVTLAALKKFGLVADDGTGADRRANVTDLAVDILENPSIDARRAATEKAALNPSIHRELWEKYGTSLPSDLSLRWELTRDRGFTETGAAEFIPEYRDTVTFAQLAADGSTLPLQDAGQEQDDDVDVYNQDSTREMQQPKTKRHETRRERMSETASVYAIPLPRGAGTIQLEADFPISESSWQYFITLLNAMKAGLVDDDRDD